MVWQQSACFWVWTCLGSFLIRDFHVGHGNKAKGGRAGRGEMDGRPHDGREVTGSVNNQCKEILQTPAILLPISMTVVRSVRRTRSHRRDWVGASENFCVWHPWHPALHGTPRGSTCPPPPQRAAPALHQKLHKPFCRSLLERNHRTVSCRVRAVQRQERRPLTGQTGSGEVGARAAMSSMDMGGHRSLTRRPWPRRFSDETSTDLLPNGTPWTTVGAVGRPPCTSSEDTIHSPPFSPSTRQRVLALSAPVEPFHGQSSV